MGPSPAGGKEENMSNQTWPWPFVDCLIQRFGLNECEAADLSDRAQQLLDASVGRPDPVTINRLWAHADILTEKGSPMQPTWDILAHLRQEGPQMVCPSRTYECHRILTELKVVRICGGLR